MLAHFADHGSKVKMQVVVMDERPRQLEFVEWWVETDTLLQVRAKIASVPLNALTHLVAGVRSRSSEKNCATMRWARRSRTSVCLLLEIMNLGASRHSNEQLYARLRT
jgi:hypothetical protein